MIDRTSAGGFDFKAKSLQMGTSLSTILLQVQCILPPALPAESTRVVPLHPEYSPALHGAAV
jgi:hypothetical protein